MRFLLIDRIDEIRPGEFARGVKNVTMSEDFMQDHFPGLPIFPGTFTIESMAQLGGGLAESAYETEGEQPRRALLAKIDKAKFYEPCRPGDQLELHCTLESALEGAAILIVEERGSLLLSDAAAKLARFPRGSLRRGLRAALTP